ncbi:ras interacting protein [Cavenderia fasciculata]|uniref:Ras interacting protein n=1 Tax=Cavenderia fasciculata TaxID=261658 RepID=F4PIY9_CACFS|nr:ras interacting protein [Cavenderia fasciculata]EGG24275.1 ras interacting protein [Cavenderia fasciculata]|eukprot:XP_004362126.1 ras interacting protein [Cavenderia fasciculata]
MAVFCEIKDVVEQIRYKTQIFYEAMKRDSIADQLYNFSNDDASNDQSIPYSKSLERDYSSLIYIAKQQQANSPVNVPTITTTTSAAAAAANGNTTAAAIPPPVINKPQPINNNNNNNSNSNNNNNNNNNNNAAAVDQQKCKIVTFSASQSSKPTSNLKNNVNSSTKPTPTPTTTTTTIAPTATTGNNTNSSTGAAGNSTTSAAAAAAAAANNGPVFNFTKQPFKTPPVAHDSLLTKIVKPNDSEKDLFSEYGEIIPPPGMGMLLSIHTGIAGIGLLKIRVIDKATVVQTIVATLKTYFQLHSATSSVSSSSGQPQMIPDPKAYFLRIADDDGRVDEDYPTLDPTQMIYKFKDEAFVLCVDRKYERSSSMTTSAGSSGGSSNNGLAPPTEGHKKSHGRQTSYGGGSTDASLLAPPIKITLPDSSITKVAYQPDMKLKELLINTCKKRKLNFSEHIFQYENGQPVNMQITMEQLGTLDIVLVSVLRRSMSGDGSVLGVGDDNDGPADIFWHDALAGQYKQYEVVKLKKYGSKQERIIGIDQERITNMSPNPKKEQETKRPARLIKDVLKVSLTDKQKHFTIEYIDGKSYVYECKSHPLASMFKNEIKIYYDYYDLSLSFSNLILFNLISLSS